jgi:CTP:molybdopterin cytidylyltransferase MocA
MSQSFSAPVARHKKLINALIDRFANSPASIVAAISRDQPANPILFRRDLYPELLKLTGDDRGLSLLEKHEKTAARRVAGGISIEYGSAQNVRAT